MANPNTGLHGMNVGPMYVYPNAAGTFSVLLPNGAILTGRTELEAEQQAVRWATIYDVPCDIRYRR